ncbi:MAG: hypothetical protein WKG01_28255 [Kofleriaceae bacterium]
MRTFQSLAIALALAACGSKGEPTTPSQPAVAASAPVELGEMAMLEGDTPMVKIHADGTTEMSEGPGEFRAGPTIKADGTVEFQGQPVARIQADGTIVSLGAGAGPLPIVVTADKATITERDKQIGLELSASGELTVVGTGMKPDKPVRIQGADTPGKRRTVLAFASIMFMKSSDDSHVEPPPAPPP